MPVNEAKSPRSERMLLGVLRVLRICLDSGDSGR
jgi:hypothetical protein